MCSAPDCDGQLRSTYMCDATICNVCGIQKQVLLSHIVPRDHKTEPLQNVYSRLKRFKGITEALFRPSPSHKDNKMIEYLSDYEKFNNCEELLCAMKKSKLSDKRYCNLHCFCRLFVNSYKTPQEINVEFVMKRLGVRFNDIEFCFLTLFPKIQFFNYRFLLTELLLELNLNDFVQFVKNLKCKIRLAYYHDLLNQIKELTTASDRFTSICSL